MNIGNNKFLLASVVFSLFCFACPVYAQTVYFEDDFETGEEDAGWVFARGQVVTDPTNSNQGFVFAGQDVGDGYIQSGLKKTDFDSITNVEVSMKWYDDGIDVRDEHKAWIEPQSGIGNVGLVALDTPHFWLFFEDPNNEGQVEVETEIERSVGWHEFRFFVTPSGTEVYIDNQLVDVVAFITTLNNIEVQGEFGNAVYWDDVLVESIEDAEPLELFVTKDSMLRNGTKNRNEGANPLLDLGDQRRQIIGFDLSEIDVENVSSASLVFSVNESDPAGKWGNEGRYVAVHQVLMDWEEGNGKDIGLPNSQSTRGVGEGVTWNCATDTLIENQNDDCASQWDGGSIAATASDEVLHTNNMTGEVIFDVTADVLSGAESWLLKKVNEGQGGNVRYYSKDNVEVSSDPHLMPRLVLEF